MTAAEREASVYFVANDDDDEEHVRNSNIIDSMSKNRTLIVAISLGEGLAIAVFCSPSQRDREREREGRHLIIRITDVNFEHRFVIVGINIRRHDF